MSRNDIESTGAPVWPIARQGKELASPQAWAPSSQGPSELNLATLWRVIHEWRWLIMGSIAVSAAAALIFTFLTTPLYSANAVLEISPPTVEVTAENSRFVRQIADRDYLGTQYGLLQSRSLAERVAQDLNLAGDPAFVPQDASRAQRLRMATDQLMNNFEVEPISQSRLVQIRYVADSPTRAAQIVNSFANNFINSNLERRYQATSYARDFLERQIAKVKGELENSERKLVAYAQQQEIINTTSGEGAGDGDVSSLQGASLVSLNEALAAAQSKRIAAEQKYRQARAIGATSEVTQSTAPLRAQRAALVAEYQEKLQSFKPDYPDMVKLRTKIEALDDQIRLEAGTVRGGQSNTLLAEYQAALAEERSLQARVNQLKGAVLDLRGRSIDYNILQREVDTNRTLYDALLQRYKEIGVAGGVGTNTVAVVDRAEPPGGPYKPNLLFNLLVGLVLGLLGGVGAALLLEFLNDTIKMPDDVREKLQLASLGVVPNKRGKGAVIAELEDQASPISEAYHSIRTSLQFATSDGSPRSLLITSTRAAEGKSSTAFALAQNYARLGGAVLLIDADLRKPAFATDKVADAGLANLLTMTGNLEPQIIKTSVENLWLLPCGPLPPNPAELLASPKLQAIINDAVQRFDIVLIDGPPVLGLADAPLLSAVCSATLLVIESGKTRTKAAMDAVHRLQSAGGHLVGAVLTKYKHKTHGYGYYGYEAYRYGGTGQDRTIRLIAQSDG